MGKSGFSLVELMVALVIITILTTVSTVQFSQYTRKNAAESQMRQLYADIVELRSTALFEKRTGVIRVGSSSYSRYSSENTTVSPYATKKLEVSVISNNSDDIIYSTKGLLSGGSTKVVCVADTTAAPVDSIVVSSTSIQLGKRNEGATCAENNIVAK